MAARHRLEAAKARTDMREWQVKRRERTRQLIELGGLVVKAGLVELADDDRHRPAVGDDVMHGQKQDMAIRIEPEYPPSDHGTRTKVKGFFELSGSSAARLIQL